jgi:excisionase family DNA binding protein
MERQTLTVEEAAAALGISRGAAYAAARQGAIPTLRIGRRLIVPRAAIARMLETCVATASDGPAAVPVAH